MISTWDCGTYFTIVKSAKVRALHILCALLWNSALEFIHIVEVVKGRVCEGGFLWSNFSYEIPIFIFLIPKGITFSFPSP